MVPSQLADLHRTVWRPQSSVWSRLTPRIQMDGWMDAVQRRRSITCTNLRHINTTDVSGLSLNLLVAETMWGRWERSRFMDTSSDTTSQLLLILLYSTTSKNYKQDGGNRWLHLPLGYNKLMWHEEEKQWGERMKTSCLHQRTKQSWVDRLHLDPLNLHMNTRSDWWTRRPTSSFQVMLKRCRAWWDMKSVQCLSAQRNSSCTLSSIHPSNPNRLRPPWRRQASLLELMWIHVRHQKLGKAEAEAHDRWWGRRSRPTTGGRRHSVQARVEKRLSDSDL